MKSVWKMVQDSWHTNKSFVFDFKEFKKLVNLEVVYYTDRSKGSVTLTCNQNFPLLTLKGTILTAEAMTLDKSLSNLP